MAIISDSILGVIVGGVIGFVSGIGAEMVKRWLTRPIITINEHTSEVSFHLKTYHEPEGHIIVEPSRTKYTCIRVKVETKGGSEQKIARLL